MERKQSKQKKDSFAKRRKLFKNVWDAALDLENKKHKDGTKPKVIKTLRLTEMDDINIGRTKKQRIKYLRTVCTRLLDFCNRQDPDGLNELMSATRQESSDTSISVAPSPKEKKRRVRKKKKVQRVYTYVTLPVAQPDKDKVRLSIDAKVEGPITHRGTIPLRDLSAPRLNRSTLIKQYLDERNNLENAPLSVTPIISEIKPAGDALRKVVKKKHRIRPRPTIVPTYTAKVSNYPKKNSGTKRDMT